MPEYTLATLLTVLAVLAVELFWLKTGIFRKIQFWLSMGIMLSFQILVDGWLTKLSDPIVIYNESTMLGVRWPWDIPVEDFGFGFAIITLTLIVWLHLGKKHPTPQHSPTTSPTPAQDRQDSSVHPGSRQ